MLDWQAVSEPDVAGYFVRYGTTSQNYTFRIDAGAKTSVTVSGLVEGSTYYFSVTSYDKLGNESIPSNEASFAVWGSPLPVITSQPASATNAIGATAAFAATAHGPPPLIYHWWKNTTPITGATAPSLILRNVSVADAANYSLVVSNLAGFVVSSFVTLSVLDPVTRLILTPPAILTPPPATMTSTAGKAVTFSAKVGGSAPLYYQWWKNNVKIAGAIAPSLTLANVSDADAANYSLVVSNRAGFAVSSVATLSVLNLSTLSVLTPPAISSPLVSRTNNAGTAATFSANVIGSAPLRYQWWKNAAPITGATTASLTLAKVSDADAANYSLVVSNRAGWAVSSVATLRVIDPPVILTQPSSQTKKAGATALFSVIAGGTPPLTYKWQQNANPIVGATNSTLVLTNINEPSEGNYVVVVSNPAGSVSSRPAALNVTEIRSILSLTLTRGSISAGSITKSKAADATTAPTTPLPGSLTPRDPMLIVTVPLTISPGLDATYPTVIEFSVEPAHSYELQASADLRSWTTIGETGVVTANSLAQFEDPEPRECSARFYRLVCHHRGWGFEEGGSHSLAQQIQGPRALAQ